MAKVTQVVGLTDLEVEFIKRACNLKDAVMPLDEETLDDETFKSDFGYTKKTMNNTVEGLYKKFSGVIGVEGLSDEDLGVLKYYKEGGELCGFEGVHTNLCDKDYLDGDLEVTNKGRELFDSYKDWENIQARF